MASAVIVLVRVNGSAITLLELLLIVARLALVSTSQMHKLPSHSPAIIRPPSGEKQNAVTAELVLKVKTCLPVAASLKVTFER
jgi:hypothetical protein